MSKPEDAGEEIWESKESLKNIATFLRGSDGLPVRDGIQNGKRIHYFRGDKFREFLLNNESTSKNRPNIDKKSDCMKIGQGLIEHGFIHRSKKVEGKKRILEFVRPQTFEVEGYYTWMYEGDQSTKYFMSFLLVCSFLTCVCFPIWPMWAKLCAWYLSVALLIVMFIIIIVRLVVFLFFWTFGMDIWILPNLFDETLSVADSFRPLISVKKTPDGEGMYRIIFVCLFAMFVYWVQQQPSEWDNLMDAQRQIIDDIYQARLISDYSQDAKDNLDTIHVPDLEELMADVDDEEAEAAARLEEYMDNLLDEEEGGEDEEEGGEDEEEEKEAGGAGADDDDE